MPTLPDFTSLGGNPRIQPSQGMGDAARSFVPEPNIGRENIEIAAQSGRGMEHLGAALEKVGEAGLLYARHQNEQLDHINNVRADADYLIKSTAIRTAIDSTTDPEQIAQLKIQAASLPSSVTANLSEGQRELMQAKYTGHAADIFAHADKKIFDIKRASDLAASNDTLENLSNTFKTGDFQTRAQAHDLASKIYDNNVSLGYMSANDAQKLKDSWTENALTGRYKILPPAERIVALGGVMPGSVASGGLPPIKVALLNAIAGPESNGHYNIRYTPSGGAVFTGFDKHPALFEDIPGRIGSTGQPLKSSAAGRYQFTKSTWDEIAPQVGANNFSPENQDKAALFLAERDYKNKTGRDIYADLQANGFTPEIAKTLSPTWEGLGVNPKKAMAAYNATLNGAPDVSLAADPTYDPEASALPIDKKIDLLQQAIAEQYKITSAQREAQKSLSHEMEADINMVAETGLPMNGLRDKIAPAFGQEILDAHDAERDRAGAYFNASKAMESSPDYEVDKIVAGLAPVPESKDYPSQKYWYDKAYKLASSIKEARLKDPAAAVDNSPYVQKARESYDQSMPSTYQNIVKARLLAQSDLGIPKELQMVMPDSEAKRYASAMRPMAEGQANLMLQKDLINGILKDVNTRFGANAPRAWQQINQHVTLKGKVSEYLDYVSNQLSKDQSVSAPTPSQSDAIQKERDASRAASIAGITPPQNQSVSQPTKPSAPQPPVRKVIPDTGAFDLLRSDPQRYMPFFLKKDGWVDYVPQDLIKYVPPEELKKRRVWYPDANQQVGSSND